jgi:hypothetical protein
MKSLIVAASALIIATAPAFAGGYGYQSPTSPQFANATALNYAKQLGSVNAAFSKGGIKQVTGAGAEAHNQSYCGCPGSQTANAFAKNLSIQTATIGAVASVGSINQSAVATSLAKNTR